jgi:hypothetical protein
MLWVHSPAVDGCSTNRLLEVRILSPQPRSRVSEPPPIRGFEVDHQLSGQRATPTSPLWGKGNSRLRQQILSEVGAPVIERVIFGAKRE